MSTEFFTVDQIKLGDHMRESAAAGRGCQCFFSMWWAMYHPNPDDMLLCKVGQNLRAAAKKDADALGRRYHGAPHRLPVSRRDHGARDF